MDRTFDDLADGRSAIALLHAISSDGGVQLTPQECRLIANFRAMKDSAKHTMVDVSEEWARALPAARAKLTLVC